MLKIDYHLHSEVDGKNDWPDDITSGIRNIVFFDSQLTFIMMKWDCAKQSSRIRKEDLREERRNDYSYILLN